MSACTYNTVIAAVSVEVDTTIHGYTKDCAPELQSFHLLLLGGDAGDEAKKVFGVLQLGSIQRSIFEFPVSHFYRIVAAVLARLHGNCAEKYRSCLATQQSGFLEHEQSCISAPSYRWIDTTLCCSGVPRCELLNINTDDVSVVVIV